MLRALVTGGAGFIGSHVAAALVEAGHQVTVLDSLSTGRREWVPSGCELIEGDVRDRSAVAAATRGQDVLVHHAAFTSVPDSFDDAGTCFAVNAGGTLTLLDAAARGGVGRVVFASSSAVYADGGPAVKHEADVTVPGSPYGISKLEGEHLLQWFADHTPLTFAAFRYFNVYGPRQPADSPYAAVVPIFVERALTGRELTLHGGGGQTRDFVFVGDVVRANLAAVTARGSGVYNVGTGAATSVRSVAETVVALTGSASRLTAGAPRPGDVAACTADVTRIERDLGWRPRWTFGEGLRAMLGDHSNLSARRAGESET
jgi:UDP-glucose 4-epimerase